MKSKNNSGEGGTKKKPKDEWWLDDPYDNTIPWGAPNISVESIADEIDSAPPLSYFKDNWEQFKPVKKRKRRKKTEWDEDLKDPLKELKLGLELLKRGPQGTQQTSNSTKETVENESHVNSVLPESIKGIEIDASPSVENEPLKHQDDSSNSSVGKKITEILSDEQTNNTETNFKDIKDPENASESQSNEMKDQRDDEDDVTQLNEDLQKMLKSMKKKFKKVELMSDSSDKNMEPIKNNDPEGCTNYPGLESGKPEFNSNQELVSSIDSFNSSSTLKKENEKNGKYIKIETKTNTTTETRSENVEVSETSFKLFMKPNTTHLTDDSLDQSIDVNSDKSEGGFNHSSVETQINSPEIVDFGLTSPPSKTPTSLPISHSEQEKEGKDLSHGNGVHYSPIPKENKMSDSVPISEPNSGTNNNSNSSLNVGEKKDKKYKSSKKEKEKKKSIKSKRRKDMDAEHKFAVDNFKFFEDLGGTGINRTREIADSYYEEADGKIFFPSGSDATRKSYEDMYGTSPIPLDSEFVGDKHYINQQIHSRNVSNFVNSTLKIGQGIEINPDDQSRS